MRMPAKKQSQEKLMTQELNTLRDEAKKLYVFGQAQSEEYTDAAEKFNAAVIEKLGKENCGFLLLVTK